MTGDPASDLVFFDISAFMASRREAFPGGSSGAPAPRGGVADVSRGVFPDVAAERRDGLLTASMRPSTGFVVTSGVGALFPLADEEIVRRTRGSGGTGDWQGHRKGEGGKADVGDIWRRGRGQRPEVRSAAVKLGAVAGGSQAAVVKLASFASGRSRMGALVRYQSREGEIPLEREDGSKVEGMAALNALVSQWAKEEPGQEPSKDVLSFTVTAAETIAPGAAQSALARALAGHRYAWRAENADGQTLAYVVASAASALKDEQGRSPRIFDNTKSLGALHERLSTAFGAKVELKMRGWGHGVDGAARHLHRLTQKGDKPAVSSAGKTLDSPEANLEEAKAWKRSLRSRAPRDTAHIILSARAGTPQEAFVDAARATLAREFGGRKYAFALHTDKRHIHVHAIVRMDNAAGKRLHPGIGDFRRWRETLAEEARRQHIPMEELRRFEQANTPAYKLKDVGMAERDAATEAQHRRLVAAGRTWNRAKGSWEQTERSVHVPHRIEGRLRAQESARNWQALENVSRAAPEPSLGPGTLRLYRVERSLGPQPGAPLFTRDRAKAEALAITRDAKLFYVDVAASRWDELKPTRSDPATLFVISAALYAERQEISRTDEDRIRSLATERARRAAIESNGAEIARLIQSLGDPAMTTVGNLTAARRSLEALFDEATPLLAEPDRMVWIKQKTELLAATDRLIETNREIEAHRAELRGKSFDEPKPRDVGEAFAPKDGNGEVRYVRSGADGRGQVAFVDRGDRIELRDWADRETILAAASLAVQKWGAIEVNGPRSFQATVFELAAERRFPVAKPELPEKMALQQNRSAERRERGETRFPENAPQQSLFRTPEETQISLDQVRQATEREAMRESREAIEARHLGETPASGTAEHRYQTEDEAPAARDAAGVMKHNIDRRGPAEPGRSETIQHLAQEQRSYSEQARAYNEEEAARARRESKDEVGEEEP